MERRGLTDEARHHDTGNRCHRPDHAFLHGGYSLGAVPGQREVGLDEQRVPRLEPDIPVERALEAAHRDEG